MLIGVSRYEHLEDLPGVRGNVRDLAAQLRDPAVWGLPEDRCHEVLDPANSSDALGPLRATTDTDIDTLVVYYSGHGLIDPRRGDLWLGLPGSIIGKPDTSLLYEWLRQELLDSPVERTIVILDCCYSGRALGFMGNAQTAVANGAMVEGTYLIASAAESVQALAPPGARHTAFTGELVKLLAHGVPDGPELLRLDAVFDHLSTALRAQSWPEPQRRERNTAGQLPIFRNRAYAPIGTGRRLADRYVLGPPLRGDALTQTYRAHDTELDRPVIIKLMHPSAAADTEVAGGFRRRARARALLRHPLVAVLLDIGSLPQNGISCPYLVTEDVTASSLGTLMRRELPHPEWAVHAISELLGMLDSAHALGVFGWHLDPESVVLTPDHHVKVIDLDDAPDGRSDLYEAGGLLYGLLTGVSPAPEATTWKVAPPSAHQPAVSEEVDAVVLKALAADPAERYDSAGAMRQAVEGLRGRTVRGVPTPVSPSQPAPASPPQPALAMRYAIGSHKGMLLQTNEDSAYAGPRLLALADGGKDRPAGDVASAEVISAIVSLDDDEPRPDLLTALADAVLSADDQLRALVGEDPRLEGMSSALTAVLWTGDRLGLAHIGNTRAYLLRDGVLAQITHDHTWVQRLADDGRITDEEARNHPRRLVLTRALGQGERIRPNLSLHEVRAGDRYLICSDGLSGVVSHQTLEETLAAYQSPEATVRELIQLALRGGGPDNITAIVADLLALDSLVEPASEVPLVVGAVAERQLGPSDVPVPQAPHQDDVVLSLRFAAGSHKGMVREINEDSGYAGPRLLALADGLGGAQAGEVASAEAISALVALDDDVPRPDILTALQAAVQRANEQLRATVEEDPRLEGMGSTLTAMLWTGKRLGLVHIGDSRAYLLRDGVLTRITQDHTWVQRLVEEGRITEEESHTHPQRSLLMKALTGGPDVEPDLSIREARPGDRYLICSDGLSGVVSHQTLEETLAVYQSPEATVQELIQLALRGGGPDNITAIVADLLNIDGADTLARRLSDTPVVVGAIAEQHRQPHANTPAEPPSSRAAKGFWSRRSARG
ncbi:caspase, EACC1-associated type [Streptomyces sp. MMG1533]|uniref:caspase, EACC1-associated type n=1 Tax=Streptomyces sp. MMG1533 TaxID=1415546 RepID=UPI000A425938